MHAVPNKSSKHWSQGKKSRFSVKKCKTNRLGTDFSQNQAENRTRTKTNRLATRIQLQADLQLESEAKTNRSKHNYNLDSYIFIALSKTLITSS